MIGTPVEVPVPKKIIFNAIGKFSLPKPNTPAKVRRNRFLEMLAALQTADERTSFSIRAHIGNHSLFLTGVFPRRILQRAEQRGFPGLSYYEGLGRANFRVASDHRLAARYELGPIFAQLAERFHDTRLALNDISDRLFSLGDDRAVDLLLKTTFADGN